MPQTSDCTGQEGGNTGQPCPPGHSAGKAPDCVVAPVPQTTADLARVAEIDAAFESATGWGSWMIMYANEREEIVNRLRANGHDIAHNYLARNDDGSRTD